MRTAEDIVNEYRQRKYDTFRIRAIAALRPEPMRSQILTILDAEEMAEAVFDEVGVEDVVRAAGTSRGRLYALFDKHLGQGIGEKLTSLRLDAAKRLLMETDLKIYAIAIRTGFSGYEHLTRSFSRTVGIGPGAFRARARTAAERSRH